MRNVGRDKKKISHKCIKLRLYYNNQDIYDKCLTHAQGVRKKCWHPSRLDIHDPGAAFMI